MTDYSFFFLCRCKNNEIFNNQYYFIKNISVI